MELVHDFSVPVPADRAFDLLVDVEKIAPCLPGAAVTSVDGDTFEGGMKIKLGPISMTFKGDGELVEKDATARRAVIQAQGRDAKGNGGAQATVTATLAERDGATDVHVVTDLNVTGKAAQFGGGVMKDVSNRMLAQFADNLSQLIQSGAASSTTPTAASSTSSSTAPAFTPSGGDGLDAMGLLFGSEAVKSIARPLVIGATGLVVGYLYGKSQTLERIVRSVL
ncbi:SRPBCC family protein [Nocardioides sp. STR2]|uniref:SRPBCC family protein n=1 Tax=Nocardioides pini TaxID=2975053 RepID=A0ABT4CBJ0_9ACTN|nr:SRPBCC family protein [Nocardioides pini]MCY4726336.1 SRPBCC family protein [Nocardioides pini]